MYCASCSSSSRWMMMLLLLPPRLCYNCCYYCKAAGSSRGWLGRRTQTCVTRTVVQHRWSNGIRVICHLSLGGYRSPAHLLSYWQRARANALDDTASTGRAHARAKCSRINITRHYVRQLRCCRRRRNLAATPPPPPPPLQTTASTTRARAVLCRSWARGRQVDERRWRRTLRSTFARRGSPNVLAKSTRCVSRRLSVIRKASVSPEQILS